MITCRGEVLKGEGEEYSHCEQSVVDNPRKEHPLESYSISSALFSTTQADQNSWW